MSDERPRDPRDTPPGPGPDLAGLIAGLDQEIAWEGDLDDDCHARWGGMLATAEYMGKNAWHAAVYPDGGREPIFHAAEDDIRPMTGAAARRLCEAFLRAAWLRNNADPIAAALAGLRARAEAAEARTTEDAQAIGKIYRVLGEFISRAVIIFPGSDTTARINVDAGTWHRLKDSICEAISRVESRHRPGGTDS